MFYHFTSYKGVKLEALSTRHSNCGLLSLSSLEGPVTCNIMDTLPSSTITPSLIRWAEHLPFVSVNVVMNPTIAIIISTIL